MAVKRVCTWCEVPLPAKDIKWSSSYDLSPGKGKGIITAERVYCSTICARMHWDDSHSGPPEESLSNVLQKA